MWKDTSKDWLQLSEEERKEAGKKRAELHNKGIRRIQSFTENTYLFNEFVSFCTNNKINLLIVVAPATKYYLQTLNPEYKDIFYNVLNNADGIIHLLDLSDESSYLTEDFIDADHLSDFGAAKMTQSILSMLKELSNA